MFWFQAQIKFGPSASLYSGITLTESFILKKKKKHKHAPKAVFKLFTVNL